MMLHRVGWGGVWVGVRVAAHGRVSAGACQLARGGELGHATARRHTRPCVCAGGAGIVLAVRASLALDGHGSITTRARGHALMDISTAVRWHTARWPFAGLVRTAGAARLPLVRAVMMACAAMAGSDGRTGEATRRACCTRQTVSCPCAERIVRHGWERRIWRAHMRVAWSHMRGEAPWPCGRRYGWGSGCPNRPPCTHAAARRSHGARTVARARRAAGGTAWVERALSHDDPHARAHLALRVV
jgi:hypothetical protein